PLTFSDHVALYALRFTLGQALRAKRRDDTPASAAFDSQHVFFEMDCPLRSPFSGFTRACPSRARREGRCLRVHSWFERSTGVLSSARGTMPLPRHDFSGAQFYTFPAKKWRGAGRSELTGSTRGRRLPALTSCGNMRRSKTMRL